MRFWVEAPERDNLEVTVATDQIKDLRTNGRIFQLGIRGRAIRGMLYWFRTKGASNPYRWGVVHVAQTPHIGTCVAGTPLPGRNGPD